MMNITHIQQVSPEEFLTEILAGVDSLLMKYKKDNPERKNNEWLTRKETAELLKVSLVTLHNWSKNGILQAYKIGNRVRYRKDEIEKSIKPI